MGKVCLRFLILAFLVNILGPLPLRAGEFVLPEPGTLVHLSPSFDPPILKGIKIHPDQPFKFDFILDKGNSAVMPAPRLPGAPEGGQEAVIKRLIKYFLASLTIPEADLWVNLSPYEKDRIVPDSFGQTEMGRDLLAQDYMLKQITASLIYPEDEIGKKFWKRIYQEAAEKFGTSNIPVNTFNKVWIVPEKAVVYENAKAGTAYVVESTLKVMLEEDYLSLSRHSARAPQGNPGSTLAQDIIREIVIPQLTKEVNEGKNFAQLRQVYNSLILATWYKKKIKDSILSQVYADKNKVAGIGITDKLVPTTAGTGIQNTETIYRQYLHAFKKGVYNYIKEELDPATQQPIPRKYFSGGFSLQLNDQAMTVVDQRSSFWKNAVKGLMAAALAGNMLLTVGCSIQPQQQNRADAFFGHLIHQTADMQKLFQAKATDEDRAFLEAMRQEFPALFAGRGIDYSQPLEKRVEAAVKAFNSLPPFPAVSASGNNKAAVQLLRRYFLAVLSIQKSVAPLNKDKETDAVFMSLMAHISQIDGGWSAGDEGSMGYRLLSEPRGILAAFIAHELHHRTRRFAQEYKNPVLAEFAAFTGGNAMDQILGGPGYGRRVEEITEMKKEDLLEQRKQIQKSTGRDPAHEQHHYAKLQLQNISHILKTVDWVTMDSILREMEENAGRLDVKIQDFLKADDFERDRILRFDVFASELLRRYTAQKGLLPVQTKTLDIDIGDKSKIRFLVPADAAMRVEDEEKIIEYMLSKDTHKVEELAEFGAGLRISLDEFFSDIRQLANDKRFLFSDSGWTSFVPLVDPKTGRPTGEIKNWQVAKMDKDWFPTAAVFLFDSTGKKVFIQLRKKMRQKFETLDVSVGGGVELGHDGIRAAIAETQQELALRISPADLHRITNDLPESSGLFRLNYDEQYLQIQVAPEGTVYGPVTHSNERSVTDIFYTVLTPEAERDWRATVGGSIISWEKFASGEWGDGLNEEVQAIVEIDRQEALSLLGQDGVRVAQGLKGISAFPVIQELLRNGPQIDAAMSSFDNMAPIQIGDAEIRKYFGDDVWQRLSEEGEMLYIRPLDAAKDRHFIDQWQNDYDNDLQWHAQWEGKDGMKEDLPRFKYLPAHAIGLFSQKSTKANIMAPVEIQTRLEGYIGIEFVTKDFVGGHVVHGFGIPAMETYYRNVSRGGELKGVIDMLFDVLIKFSADPKNHMDKTIGFNAITPGSKAFAKRRQLSLDHRGHALLTAEQADNIFTGENLGGRFKGILLNKFSSEDAIKELSNIMVWPEHAPRKEDNGDNTVGIIRMNFSKNSVLLTISPELNGWHKKMMEAAHRSGAYAKPSIGEEWISIAIERDLEGRMKSLLLIGPGMAQPSNYSENMINFLAKEKGDFSSVRDEIIQIAGLFAQAAQRAGLNPAGIPVTVSSSVFPEADKKSEISLEALAQLPLDRAMTALENVQRILKSADDGNDNNKPKLVAALKDLIFGGERPWSTRPAQAELAFKEAVAHVKKKGVAWGEGVFAQILVKYFYARHLPRLYVMHRLLWEEAPDLGLHMLDESVYHIVLNANWHDLEPGQLKGLHHTANDNSYLRTQLEIARKALAEQGTDLKQRFESIIEDGDEELRIKVSRVTMGLILFQPKYAKQHLNSRVIIDALNADIEEIVKGNEYELNIDLNWGKDVISAWENSSDGRFKAPGAQGRLLERIQNFLESPADRFLRSLQYELAPAVTGFEMKYREALKNHERYLEVSDSSPAQGDIIMHGGRPFMIGDVADRTLNPVRYWLLDAVLGEDEVSASNLKTGDSFRIKLEIPEAGSIAENVFRTPLEIENPVAANLVQRLVGAITDAFGGRWLGTPGIGFRALFERFGPDAAMNAVKAPGGIDLSSDKALSVQNDGQAIQFNVDPAMLKQWQNAPGFTPVIINIRPLPAGQAGMAALHAFLGITA